MRLLKFKRNTTENNVDVQKIFNDLISEIFNEYFKPLKWKKQGPNFRFFTDDGVAKIINFQRSKWNTKTECEFTVNYGMYFEKGDVIENKNFKEYDCQFRRRAIHKKGWYRITGEKDVKRIKKMLLKVFKEANYYFDMVESKEQFITKILNGELQKYALTNIMHADTCELLISMGYQNEVDEYLKQRRKKNVMKGDNI